MKEEEIERKRESERQWANGAKAMKRSKMKKR